MGPSCYQSGFTVYETTVVRCVCHRFALGHALMICAYMFDIFSRELYRGYVLRHQITAVIASDNGCCYHFHRSRGDCTGSDVIQDVPSGQARPNGQRNDVAESSFVAGW